MGLNWTIEVFSAFITGTILLLTSIYTFRYKHLNKIQAIFLFRLTWNSMALFFYLEGISYLLLSIPIHLLHTLSIIIPTLFFIFCINFILKETIYSKGLILVFGIIVLYIYLAFQPGSLLIMMENGIMTILFGGQFELLAYILTMILPVFILYWGYLTWKNSPFLIKRESTILLIGTFIASVGSGIFYLLNIYFPLFIHLSNLALAAGTFISSAVLVYQPQLLFILPFTLYRISVKDCNGYPLFDHYWSNSEVSEVMFTGFINAVQIMSQEVLQKGGLLDIHLQEGVLTLQESENVTVGLISSKSSKLVKDALKNFTLDFESMFQKEIKANERDPEAYENAYELIQKYFSNFPSRIITNEDQELLLRSQLDLPKELENKLKTIFTDENELKKIKLEIAKSPYLSIEDYLKLYNELKLEEKALEVEQERKKLDL